MSYPFTLRFLVGRLLIDDQIEEKVCIVEDERVGSPNEIWSSDQLPYDLSQTQDYLGMIEFEIGANQSNYQPEFKLTSMEKYVWSNPRDGIKLTLMSLDRVRISATKDKPYYRLYYILGSRPPPGLISGITKRFGKNLLEQVSTQIKQKNRVFWSILLKPKKSRTNAKIDPFGSNPDDIPAFSAFSEGKHQFDILGESLSTNCAEIEHTF